VVTLCVFMDPHTQLDVPQWWVGLGLPWTMSDHTKTNYKIVVTVLNHSRSIALVKGKSCAKLESQLWNVTCHLPFPLFPDVLPAVHNRGHIFTIIKMNVKYCVFHSWQTFYCKPSDHDIQPAWYKKWRLHLQMKEWTFISTYWLLKPLSVITFLANCRWNLLWIGSFIDLY